eukprot:1898456-Lingulodinium_polyedra.AAC.1
MTASQRAANLSQLSAWLDPGLMPAPPSFEELESDQEPEDGSATADVPPKPVVVPPEVGTPSVVIVNFGACRRAPFAR